MEIRKPATNTKLDGPQVSNFHFLVSIFRGADERDENNGHNVFDAIVARAAGAFGDDLEDLRLPRGAAGDEHAPAGLELLDERHGNFGRAGSDDDAVEGSFFGPAEIAIAD